MNHPRIDNLRHMVAAIGRRQREYWEYFPKFADRLEREFGEYLGDVSCVALSSASGEFSFDHGSYRHGGIGYERGQFRIPLMVRLKNLNDDGDLLVRVQVYFTKDADNITAEVDGKSPINFSDSDLAQLHEYMYQHLCSLFERRMWFAERGAEYGGSAIGFVRGRDAI